MTPTIAEIEARLQAISLTRHDIDETGCACENSEGDWIRYSDSLAHAPTDMRHLLSELHAARQRERVAGMREMLVIAEESFDGDLPWTDMLLRMRAAMQKGAV